MTPKVSVIVPVYNVEPYLDRCVSALLCQTLKDIEIVLVDDESPDNCPALCDEYARRDPRVRVVHKKNGGLGLACNSGLEVATGEYVAFCDSDDWVEPEMYADMYNVAKQEKADMVLTGLRRVDGQGNILGYLPHYAEFKRFCESEVQSLLMDMISSVPNDAVDRHIQVSAKTVLYKSETLFDNYLKFHSEREYPSEDLLFNVSVLCKSRKVCALPCFYYNYYVNVNSITSTIKHDHFNKMLRTAKMLLEIVSETTDADNGILDNCSLQNRIHRFIIGESRSYSRQILMSRIPKKDKLLELKSLSGNSVWNEIVETYPIRQMPAKHRIPLELLLKRRYFLLECLYRMSK